MILKLHSKLRNHKKDLNNFSKEVSNNQERLKLVISPTLITIVRQ